MNNKELFENEKRQFKKRHQNCWIIAVARYLRKIEHRDAQERSNLELLDFVKEKYTDKGETYNEEVSIGFATMPRDISLIPVARSLIIISKFCLEDLEYIKLFKTCLILQQYGYNITGHAEVIDTEEIEQLIQSNKIQKNFKSTLVLLI